MLPSSRVFRLNDFDRLLVKRFAISLYHVAHNLTAAPGLTLEVLHRYGKPRRAPWREPAFSEPMRPCKVYRRKYYELYWVSFIRYRLGEVCGGAFYIYREGR